MTSRSPSLHRYCPLCRLPAGVEMSLANGDNVVGWIAGSVAPPLNSFISPLFTSPGRWMPRIERQVARGFRFEPECEGPCKGAGSRFRLFLLEIELDLGHEAFIHSGGYTASSGG